MGCRVVPACQCLHLFPFLAAPRREPQGGSPCQYQSAGALSISPSTREHPGWGKPTPIMFVPLI